MRLKTSRERKAQARVSFFVPGRKAASMSGGLNNCRRKHPKWEMIMRYVEESGVKGTRIWRVK